MLAVVDTHPVQYRAPVYRALQQRFGIPVTAIYGGDFSVAGYRDDEFGATFAWDQDLLGGYTSTFLSRVDAGGAARPADVPARGIVAALRRTAPDAVLLVGYSPFFHQAAFAATFRAGLPILFRGETTDHARQRGAAKRVLRDAALAALYRCCARLLYVGRRSHEHFRRLQVAERDLVFSPYCVDTAAFDVGDAARAHWRTRTRRDLGIPDEAIVLLFAGKLTAAKGPQLLVRAAQRLAAWPRPIHVVFVGSGEMADTLASASDARVRVLVLGFKNQSELSRYYHAGDVLVLPSASDTWGLAVNDALHHGVPCVVSSAVGCAPDLVHAGRTGETCEPGDIDSLAAALERARRLIGSADARAACLETIARYTVDAAAQGIADAYRAVVDRRGAAGAA